MNEIKRIFITLLTLTIASSANAKGISIIVVENHDKIADCKKVKIGSIIKTTGYYVNGDEGDAEYNVIEDDGNITVDGYYIIRLKNGLLAKLNVKMVISILNHLGVKQLKKMLSLTTLMYFKKLLI